MAVFTSRTRDFGFGDLSVQNVSRVVRDHLRSWHSSLRPHPTGHSMARAGAPGAIRMSETGIKRMPGLAATGLEHMCSSCLRPGWHLRPSR